MLGTVPAVVTDFPAPLGALSPLLGQGCVQAYAAPLWPSCQHWGAVAVWQVSHPAAAPPDIPRSRSKFLKASPPEAPGRCWDEAPSAGRASLAGLGGRVVLGVSRAVLSLRPFPPGAQTRQQ